MRAFLLSAGLMAAFAGTSVQAQTTLSLTPSKDVVIVYHDGYPSENSNYNTVDWFAAFSQPGHNYGVNHVRGLVDFDLSSIPAEATIFGAFLTFSGKGPVADGVVASQGSMGANSSQLLRVTTPWNDNSVTWNTQPTTTSMNAVTVPASTYTMQNYINIDVTELVQDMVDNPASSHGFMLRLPSETPSRGLVFHGGLATQADKRPTLVVAYGRCGEVGIDEVHDDRGGMTVTPNLVLPGSMIQITMDRPVRGSRLILMDNTGRTVHQEGSMLWPMEIVVPAVASGAYTWQVVSPNGEMLGQARMVVQ